MSKIKIQIYSKPLDFLSESALQTRLRILNIGTYIFWALLVNNVSKELKIVTIKVVYQHLYLPYIRTKYIMYKCKKVRRIYPENRTPDTLQ